MPFTLNLKRIVIGSAVAIALGASGIGAAAAANAATSDLGITAVSGLPENVIPGEAITLDGGQPVDLDTSVTIVGESGTTTAGK